MTEKKPNILFLLIDSFNSRNCFGNEKTSITPNIDSLISNGVYFDQVITCASTTVPSICGMFTGTYPFNATVLDGNHYKLNTKIQNFVSILEKNGYHVKAMVPDGIKHIRLEKIFHENLDVFNSFSTTYDGLGNKIISSLRSDKMKQPWFLYVHLYDLHGKATFYKNKPNGFESIKFGKNQYDRMVSELDIWIGKFLQIIDKDNTLVILTADHGSDVGTYDSELEKYHQYWDNVRNKIHQNELLVNVGVRVTSKIPQKLIPFKKKISEKIKQEKKEDEEYTIQSEFDKIEIKHNDGYKRRRLKNCVHITTQCFDDRYKVPLIFYGKFFPSDLKIHNQIRNIDIFPTILELLDIQFTKTDTAVSLLPLIKGKKIDGLVAYVDSIGNTADQRTDDTIGIRHTDLKYFRDRKKVSCNVHLYDLNKDPREENNICKEHPDTVKKQEDILSKISANNKFQAESIQSLTDKKEEEKVDEILKKLGYK